MSRSGKHDGLLPTAWIVHRILKRIGGKLRKWHDIRKAREKCSAFPVGINEPGAARWVTAAWARKWGIASGELSDRILAAEYLQSIGRLVSTTLSDNGRWIGGTTNLIHDNELVAQVIFRDPDYDRYGIGTYLIYLAFEFAKKSGLSGFDMGGGLDYKGKYSPEKGQRCEVTICKGYANYQWYRVKMKVGLERILAKRQRGGPASYATIKSAHKLVAERQSENDESLAGDNHHENLPVTAT